MINVFLLHGIDSFPFDNYHGWLRDQLEPLDCRVIAPQFPIGKGQTLDNWLRVFNEHSQFLDEKTLMDGHSAGALLALRALPRYQVRIRALFMNAAYIGVPPKVSYQGQETFEREPYDWEVIRSRSQAFHVFYSDNDRQISPENGMLLARNLGVEPILVEGAGHFNKKSGYNERNGFPLLLEMMRRYIIQPEIPAQ